MLIYLNVLGGSDSPELIDRKCAPYLFCYYLHVAMKHNFVYILVTDTYHMIILFKYHHILPHSGCLHVHITVINCSILTWSYHVELPVERTTLVLNTTTTPMVQDYSPLRSPLWIYGRNKVYLITSARNSDSEMICDRSRDKWSRQDHQSLKV